MFQVRNGGMIDMLRDLPRLSKEDPAFRESVYNLAFVPNADDGTLQRVNELYVATPELEGLLDARHFASVEFREQDVSGVLLQLGMKTRLDVKGTTTAAQSVTKLWGLHTAESRALAFDRSQSLLQYLDMHCGTIASPHQADEFEAVVAGLMWLPVMTHPPEEGLPWDSRYISL